MLVDLKLPGVATGDPGHAYSAPQFRSVCTQRMEPESSASTLLLTATGLGCTQRTVTVPLDLAVGIALE